MPDGARLFQSSALPRFCTKCRALKPPSEFYKNHRYANGLTPRCKTCLIAASASWHATHPERTRELQRRWHEAHKDDPDFRKQQSERWNRWAVENRDHVNAAKRANRAANPERERTKRARRWAKPEQSLSGAMRSSMRRAFRGEQSDKNGAPWESIVGYSVADLMAHIERQFRGRMSWANFGKWHVDHIVPVASFAFRSVDDPEFRACWALTNLRPLWAGPNRSKAAKRLTLL